MPQFAPVAPIQVLEGLWAHSPEAFGTYHLLLAHHTVEHAKRFSDLFKEVAEAGISLNIIMDNSIVELGEAVDLDMIAAAVNHVNWGEHIVRPVLPDVMGSGVKTREAVMKAYPRWVESMPGNGFVAVCQGVNFQDYLESLHMFSTKAVFPEIDMLSIPRVLVKTCGTRTRAALSAREYMETHEIHFLGFSDNITDDIDSVRLVPTSGIDSAVPLRLRETFTEFVDAGKRPADWFDTAQVNAQMISNLEYARKMFQ